MQPSSNPKSPKQSHKIEPLACQEWLWCLWFDVRHSYFGEELGLELGLSLINYGLQDCRCISHGWDGVSMQSDCSDTGQTASHRWLCSHVAQSRPGPCLIVSPFVSTCHRPVFSPSLVSGYKIQNLMSFKHSINKQDQVLWAPTVYFECTMNTHKVFIVKP